MSEIPGFKNHAVVDKTGAKLGTVDGCYENGAPGRPGWLRVKSRWLHHRKYFIAMRDAKTADGDVVVAFDKETVRRAPLVDHEGSLTPPEASELGAYYAKASDASEAGRDHEG